MRDLPDKYKSQWVVEEPHCPLKDTVITMLLAGWWIAGVPAALYACGYFGIPFLAGIVGFQGKVTPLACGVVVLFAYYLWPAFHRWMRRIGQNAT